ncbi:hypothetical protein [Paraburkholderia sp. J11-2]|uniref:hypothetical protein n=1 Tax=Paraburkholderia sp. J11-2 TaxID=2805431 RepID=UPI002AB72269|nr:hypothetical protein [Paraburkholderia sp. J11-2]
MTQDELQQMEDLLIAWHRYQDCFSPQLGMPRCSPTCREYEIPTASLDARERAEITDVKIWKRNSEQVEVCVDALHWKERAVLQTVLRNKRLGADIFRSPRFAPAEAHYLYESAKDALLPKFVARGLIKIVVEAV